MASNKTWSITAISAAGSALSLRRGGETLFEGEDDERAATVSPVEYLLIATAGCLALSCRAVLNKRTPAASVEVTATGYKAAEPPSRIDRIVLTVRIGAEIDAAAVTSIVEEAEKMCTVTNTLRGAPTIEIG